MDRNLSKLESIVALLVGTGIVGIAIGVNMGAFTIEDAITQVLLWGMYAALAVGIPGTIWMIIDMTIHPELYESPQMRRERQEREIAKRLERQKAEREVRQAQQAAAQMPAKTAPAASGDAEADAA
jgi:hypothetical protein